jgi:CHAT domain-containing protein
MVLPTAVDDGPPQILFDDGGIWRDTAPVSIPETQTNLRQRVETFLSGVMRQVAQAPPAQSLANSVAFRSQFAELYRKLLPPEVRDALKTSIAQAGPTRPNLNIYFRAGAEWIPWELLHDGTDYLGVQFAIARLPIVPQATEIRPPRARLVRKVYSLLAQHVLDQAQTTDWESTFTGYNPAPAWESRFPFNGTGNFPTLTQLDEARDADILHVTCHGGLRDPGQSDFFWTLDHQNPQFFDYRITPSIAKDAKLAARPLVFGNACASVAAQGVDLVSFQGFGSSFMVGGALNFVGTLAPITKTMAISFARRFYANLFAPAEMPIAEALRLTKAGFALQKSTDPSYLFYCLYGPPDSTFKPDLT